MDMHQLSGPNKWLIQQCQFINHGQITFHVANREPDLRRKWHTRRTLKMNGGDNGVRPESGLENFELRREHMCLLEQLAQLPHGTCVVVKVAHGLPALSIDIIEVHQAA